MNRSEYNKLNTAGKLAFWDANPLVGEIQIELEDMTPFRMQCKNDDTVVKELHWTGFMGWEFATLRVWQFLSRDASEVLDIGSYTGIFSMIAAIENPQSRVFAAEPIPENAKRLRHNLSLNGLENVEVLEAAFSDRRGEATIYEHRTADGILSSVSSITNERNATGSIQIPTYTAAGFAKERGLESVGLVKIDVEHAELEVLRGMQELIARHLPDVILEVNDRKKLVEVQSFFPKTYSSYLINEDKRTLQACTGLWSKFRRDASHGRNYLFTTKDVGPVTEYLKRAKVFS